MINVEILQRQASHTYNRDHLRRISRYLVVSCFLSVLLVCASAYRLLTYPPRTTYISETTGRIIPITGSAKPVYTGPSSSSLSSNKEQANGG